MTSTQYTQNSILLSIMGNDFEFPTMEFFNTWEARQNLNFQISPPAPPQEVIEIDTRTEAIKNHLRLKAMMGHYNGTTFWGILPDDLEQKIVGINTKETFNTVVWHMDRIFWNHQDTTGDWASRRHFSRAAHERVICIARKKGHWSFGEDKYRMKQSVFGLSGWSNFHNKYDRKKEMKLDEQLQKTLAEGKKPHRHSELGHYYNRRCVVEFNPHLTHNNWVNEEFTRTGRLESYWEYQFAAVRGSQGTQDGMNLCNDFYINHKYSPQQGKHPMNCDGGSLDHGWHFIEEKDQIPKEQRRKFKQVGRYRNIDIHIPNRAWTIPQLKEFLKDNGQSTKGKHQELFERAYSLE